MHYVLRECGTDNTVTAIGTYYDKDDQIQQAWQRMRKSLQSKNLKKVKSPYTSAYLEG